MSAIGGYEMSNEMTSTLPLVYCRQACSFYSHRTHRVGEPDGGQTGGSALFDR